MRPLAFLALTVAFAVPAGAAIAQDSATAAATTAAPEAQSVRALLPLHMAYREIGLAEALGASGPYAEAARSHYRAALDKYAKNDAGAVGEAMTAAALARAALDLKSEPVPRDLPAPPAAPRGVMPMPGRGPGGEGGPPLMGPHPPMGGDMHGPPGMHGGPGGPGGPMNAGELGRGAKAAGTPEAQSLANAAMAAMTAANTAAFNGDLEGARRQERLSRDLAAAVHGLADVAHPAPHGREGTRWKMGDRGAVRPPAGAATKT